MVALRKISAFGIGKTQMLSTCCLHFSSLFPTGFYSTMVSDVLLPCDPCLRVTFFIAFVGMISRKNPLRSLKLLMSVGLSSSEG